MSLEWSSREDIKSFSEYCSEVSWKNYNLIKKECEIRNEKIYMYQIFDMDFLGLTQTEIYVLFCYSFSFCNRIANQRCNKSMS